MTARRKLIVVSNRGPVSFVRDEDGNRVARRGGGGLVTALRSLVAHHDVTWIASAMTEEDRAVAGEAGGEAIEEVARDGSPYRLRLVSHDPAAYDWFYNVVANPTLWFLQHYLWALAYAPDIDAGLHHAWEDGYVPVNRAFAEATLAELEAQPTSAVFFHDYHLYLAPRLVRDQQPDAALAHFVHIPWPEPDLWRVLPAPIRRAIHEGLLANDVVGFHAHRWRRNFLRSCRDLLETDCDFDESVCSFGDGRTFVAARPISVDPSEFEELAESDQVRAREAELEAHRPEVLVLRVDRTDPSKNVVRGFRAFEFFLDKHPELHRRVAMLALLDPSRQDIP
ncbi:MAG: alpha,alpha-trehalose-phosphate synthase (UDP-forming), partial [Gaiellaceae bacterium]